MARELDWACDQETEYRHAGEVIDVNLDGWRQVTTLRRHDLQVPTFACSPNDSGPCTGADGLGSRELLGSISVVPPRRPGRPARPSAAGGCGM